MREAYQRLQTISQIHASRLWAAGEYGWGQLVDRKTGARGMYSVPEVIQENCAILKRGDEEEIKNRLYWYLTYHPDIHAESRKALKQRNLKEEGYRAGFLGDPCEAPTTREIDRAAWEQGWRAGRNDRKEGCRV